MIKVLLSGIALFSLTALIPVHAQNTKVVKSFETVYAVKNGIVRIPVTLRDIEPSSVKKVTLSINVSGERQTIDVEPEMQTMSDGSVMFYVDVETPSETGLSDIDVRVDAIDGVKMQSSENTSKGTLMTVSRKVPHKVVIEEFTAMWCPACPSGLVGIERTKLNYGDKVLVIAVHNQDALYTKDYLSVLSTVQYNPRAMVDRDPVIGQVNPYLGSQRGDNGAKYGLGYDIEEQAAIDPVVEIKVGGDLNGKEITVKSELTMLYTGDANYGVAYVITQDSLKHPKWVQKNNLPIYYRGNEIVEKEPLWDKWLNGETEVSGVVYDDVARTAASVSSGIADVIPASVTEEQVINHEYTFDLNNYAKIKDTDNMNLCVLVIDRNTGKIVNSASAKLSEVNAIDGVSADNENVTEVARYTADGHKISVAEKGVNIVRYSDGSVRKVLVR